MNQQTLKELLDNVQSGKISSEDAVLQLRKAPYCDLGFAKIDFHRELRQGIAEVIYGEGKTKQQICQIAKKMQENDIKRILITRLPEGSADVLKKMFGADFSCDEAERTGRIGEPAKDKGIGNITVVTAGTSDIAVAEEAVWTAETFGNHVRRLYDVGVSGLHRLLDHLDDLMTANVIIAVAGMEGALPSVIGGLVDCPVIAVPTSIGYGTSFHGVTALLSMLNSCASGVSVVNIDNGFGAGYQASMINQIQEKGKRG